MSDTLDKMLKRINPVRTLEKSGENKGSAVISVKNLEKIYSGGVHAVKDVSFDVFPKQVVVIIG